MTVIRGVATNLLRETKEGAVPQRSPGAEPRWWESKGETPMQKPETQAEYSTEQRQIVTNRVFRVRLYFEKISSYDGSGDISPMSSLGNATDGNYLCIVQLLSLRYH